MIVLGLTSGLSSIGYSVLHFGQSPQQIDCSVLAGTRMKVPAPRRSAAHRLTLSVLLERAPPAIISLGPRVSPSEPDDYVVEMQLLMESLGAWMRVPVVRFDDESAIVESLKRPGAKSGKLPGLVEHHLGLTLNRNRRAMLAAGAALAAGFHFQQYPGAWSTPAP